MDFITAECVKKVLRYDKLIDVMSQALCKYSSQSVVQPLRSMVPVAKEGGLLELMPALCEDENVLGVKLVTLYPNNLDRHGVATHSAVIVMFDTTTGIPKAIMDGEVITAMRTAAVSALATKYLASPNASKLAILGAGVQARPHFEALSTVMEFKQVSIWTRTFKNGENLAREIGAVACKTVQEAVTDADVIITVTSATKPILTAEYIKPGAHINAVGACRPDWSEIDPELMRSVVLYVDSREGALKESGDVILSKAEIHAELGEMILGQKEAFRSKTTLFKSLDPDETPSILMPHRDPCCLTLGMAIEDSMTGKLVLELMSNL